VAVWLNFAPDHMDRYQTVEEYRTAKLRIFENQNAGDLAVINAEESLGSLPGKTETFSAFSTGADYSLEDGEIRFGGEAVFPFRESRLNGKHNAENVMAAMAVVHRFGGVAFEAMATAIRGYQAPPHRCEPVGVIGGVTYVNDSKATNLHALESSLRGQESPVILIAGGKNKGLDYGEVKERVRRSVRQAIAIGEMAAHVCDAWGDAVPCVQAASLAEAVQAAAAAARPGETVLLSPGTSSFDMFSGYGERGDAFRACVAALRKS
jgi:UDP-N-acetylmuramoylalanine--D-glutamate ligase